MTTAQQRAPFVAACEGQPDHLPHLIYADWLREHGDEEEANRQERVALVKEYGPSALKVIKQRERMAVEIAMTWAVANPGVVLYSSRRAKIGYGKRKQRQGKWRCIHSPYDGSFLKPETWYDAGARWNSIYHMGAVIVQNFRGKDVVTIPVPRHYA